MTTDASTEAARPTRGGLVGWLARLGTAAQVLIVAALTVAAVPMFVLMIAGAVEEQLLTSHGARTQAMVVDHGTHELTVAFQPPAGRRVRAVVGLLEGERLDSFPVESTVGVVYDPGHPGTVDLDVHVLGIGNLIDRAVTVVMGLGLLAFCLFLIGLGLKEARSALTAWAGRPGVPRRRGTPGASRAARRPGRRGPGR
jgi:amino acid transporter